MRCNPEGRASPVTTKIAMTMEDSLQAFAVRAACFIGELDVPYSEEFDGHDFGATHVIAYVGDEPAAPCVRWFQSFAMPERLAVIQRFRGHGIGQLLIERCRALAESRGCNMLYTQACRATSVTGKSRAGAVWSPSGRTISVHRRHGPGGRSQQAAAQHRSAGNGRPGCRAAARRLGHAAGLARQLVSSVEIVDELFSNGGLATEDATPSQNTR